MPLRILHISDIHFRVEAWDEDADQRAELASDLRSLIERDGGIDAILIGGDIAFSAKPAEYQLAIAWIDELLALTGLSRERVWTVPGNHDMDRDLIAASPEGLAFRLEMATCPLESVDYSLKSNLARDLDRGRRLLEPLDGYNEFALNFSCAVSPESPMWSDDLTLSVDGWRVRLTGATTVLNSGGYRHEQGHLVLGSYQCKFERRAGEVGIVMMHHPPGWIRDWSSAAPYLRRSHVWIFGHEHAYASQIDEDAGVVRLSAGAVAPERDEDGVHGPYVPSYNVIQLARVNDQLQVAVTPRIWDVERTTYTMHIDGVASFLLDVDSDASADLRTGESLETVVEGTPLAPEDLEQKDDLVESERTSLRQLTVWYLGLPLVRRRAIARQFDVLLDEDEMLPPWETYPRVLERIRDRGLINSLAEEMTIDTR